MERCGDHGATKEEVEEVFQNATDADFSRSSGLNVLYINEMCYSGPAWGRGE